MKKLLHSHGETLTETLVAILIIAISAGILSMFAGSSMKLNLTADNVSQTFYKEWSLAEEQAEGGSEGVAVFDGNLEGLEREVPIQLTGAKDELISYKEATPSEAKVIK
jgi:hypothetical protein